MNPARELAQILERWALIPRGQTLYSARGGESGSMPDWAEHLKAFDLLLQIDATLSAMEGAGRNVDHYRRWRHAWIRGLISPDTQWGAGTNGTVEIFERGAIDQLFALADVIDGESDRYQVTPDSKKESLDALDEILEAIASDTSLVELEKRYLFALVSSIREALTEASVFGSFELARRIHELVGYLNVLASDLDDRGNTPLADRLRDAGQRVRPFVVGSTIAVAGAIDVAANLKALGI